MPGGEREMEECTPCYVLNGPVHTAGPWGPLHCCTTSLSRTLSPPLFLPFLPFNPLPRARPSLFLISLFFSLPIIVSFHAIRVSLFFCFLLFGHMLGQLWMEIRLRVVQALPRGWHTCVCACVCVGRLVAIYPAELQGSSSTLYSMCMTVSVLTPQQLCEAGPLGPCPCFTGLETLSSHRTMERARYRIT